MPSSSFSNRPNVKLEVSIGQWSQNVGANTSTVGGEVWIVNTSGYTYFGSGGNNVAWTVSVDGQEQSGRSDYNLGPNGRLRVWAGSFTITHNADGTKQFGYSASASSNDLGSAYANQNDVTLTTIPRASTFTILPTIHDVRPDQVTTIDINRASTSFQHDIYYNWAGQSVGMIGGVGTSYAWSPPWSMLNNLPNDTTTVTSMTVFTLDSNRNLIGSTSANFRVNVPASVVPVVNTITVTDDNATVRDQIGAFVQGESIIKVVMASSGAYSSTVRAQQFTLDGQTAASGATVSAPQSGVRAIGAAVTDSRGRVGTKSQNITVLPYAPPTVDGQVRRATSAGAVDIDNGQYLRLDLTAQAQSLKPSTTEKNSFTLSVFTRERGATTWTARNVIPVSSLAYNTNVLISGGGIYDLTKAYEVRVVAADKLRSVTWEKTVATADILVDLVRDGVGIKKYRERGAMDVGGDVYSTGNYYAGPSLTPLVPIGTPLEWYGSTPPAGFMFEEGQAISRTTYAALFSIIGTTFGAGDGSTTFNLPNRQGRVAIGLDPGREEANTVGKRGGNWEHQHWQTVGADASLYLRQASSVPGTNSKVVNVNRATIGAGSFTTGLGRFDSTENASSLQPYIIVRNIIRVL